MTQNLNDGKCYSSKDIENRGLDAAATDFSEGSSELKHCLLNLWKLGIETTACCKGTNEKDHKEESFLKFPYIAIKIPTENKEKIFQLVKYLLAEKSLSRPNLIFKNYNQRAFSSDLSKTKVLVLERILFTNKGALEMFETIKRATDKMLSNEKVDSSRLEELLPTLNLLLDGKLPLLSPYHCFKVSIKKHSSSFGFSTFSDINKFKYYSISKSSIGDINNIIKEETIQPARQSHTNAQEK